MRIHPLQRPFTSAFLCMSLFVVVDGHALAAASASHQHHDAKQLIKDKSDGRHEIDKHGKYHVAADMKGGKIAAIHVRHETKGEVQVKKYKTHRKPPQVARSTASPRFVYASYHLAQQDLGTEWIGYSYVDDEGNEQIYWVPYDMVLDGDTGAVDYIPEN
jgi:Ni/Co efflux regulator RcnB